MSEITRYLFPDDTVVEVCDDALNTYEHDLAEAVMRQEIYFKEADGYLDAYVVPYEDGYRWVLVDRENCGVDFLAASSVTFDDDGVALADCLDGWKVRHP